MESLLSIPKSFSLFGQEIHIYGITSALAYLLGVLITAKNAKRRGFKADDIITLACYVIPLCIIGARIYFVLFSLDSFTSFWQIFEIWKGGLAFYGGLIGGAIGVIIYCLIHKKNFLALADIIVPSMICAQALGRWGNFFNQEAYGYAVTNPAWQWFPFAVYIDGVGWHMATFFYESLWDFLCFIILEYTLWHANFKNNGVIAGGYLILYGIGRAIIEGLRTDSLYLGSMRVSQVLSIIFIACGLILIFAVEIWPRINDKRKDPFNKIMKVLKKKF